MEFFKNFFREQSQESMTRLCFFLSVLNSIVISILAIYFFVYHNKDFFSHAIVLSGIFLGAGTTAKLVQKGKENESTNNLRDNKDD